MRQIKFRGRRTDNGVWETGGVNATFLNTSLEEWFIIDKMTNYPIPVDPDTVGQFTGLHDKDGKEIYEGDIVLQQGYGGGKQPMQVKFENGAFIVGYHRGSSTRKSPMLLNGKCEVIGNIHDNKSLLEGGEK